jgi:hypothetical protein
MSELVPEQVLQIVRTMQDGFDGLAMQPDFTEWGVSYKDTNDVIGVTHLRAQDAGRERWICVTQILGRDAFGEVAAAYSVREVGNGPRLVWQRDPQTVDDIEVVDVPGRRCESVSADIVTQLAVLVQGAPPHHPDRLRAPDSGPPSPLQRLRDYIGSMIGAHSRLMEGLE